MRACSQFARKAYIFRFRLGAFFHAFFLIQEFIFGFSLSHDLLITVRESGTTDLSYSPTCQTHNAGGGAGGADGRRSVHRSADLGPSCLRLGSTRERFVRYLPQARRVTFTQAVGQVRAEVGQLELWM